jgi:3-phosphoshikimate 1-carboxyvinyltransferase
MLKQMGCMVRWQESPLGEWSVTVARGERLMSGTFDLNATPDLLPIMAVVASFAEGDTILNNVAHARLKETDRIAVMAQELGKLGIQCAERPDGLVIRGSRMNGGKVLGHKDHRIVMALAVGALGATDSIEITDAEAADVTYPGFLKLLEAEPL